MRGSSGDGGCVCGAGDVRQSPRAAAFGPGQHGQADGRRQKELDNVRMAARILSGERGDPHIDKKILVEGAPASSFEPATNKSLLIRR
jgi:hypothetical protein